MTKLTANIKQIVDEESKAKYVHDIYGEKISIEEIRCSDVWGIIDEGKNNCLAIIMLQKTGEETMRISHMGLLENLIKLFFEQNIMFQFYKNIEAYYVSKNINNIEACIPKHIKDLSTKAVKFLKKAGLKKLNMIGSNYPDEVFFMVKSDLKKNALIKYDIK
jgi:hypothetical protein